MSKRTTVICDACGKDVANPTTVHVPVDQFRDVNTARTETVLNAIDFCAKCAAIALQAFVEDFGPDAGKKWADTYAPKRTK